MEIDATPREQPRRSASKHAAILEAAHICIRDLGYDRTTVEEIARRAGVGKQTVYRWWPGKSALLVELYADLAPASALEVAPSGPLETRLQRLLTALFEIYQRTAAHRILAGLLSDSAGDDAARQAVHDGLVVGRADLITRLCANLDEEVEADAVGEAVVGLVWRTLLTEPDALTAAKARQLARWAARAGRAS